MFEQVARVLGAPMAMEIGGGCGRCEALDAWTDRHRDHVLFEPFIVADAGIAAGRDHIDEAFLGDDLEPDLRIHREEGRNDCGQHEARGADRHIQPQRPGRPIAQAVDHVEGGLDFAHGGSEPFEQALAGLGRQDAARRAIEQPDTEPGFEAAHGLTEPGGTATGRAGGVPEALGASHGQKGVQLAEIDVHCSLFRTARADIS